MLTLDLAALRPNFVALVLAIGLLPGLQDLDLVKKLRPKVLWDYIIHI